MKTVFDMSTGEVIEGCQAVERQRRLENANAHPLPELSLQEITHDYREERRILPELVIADLNAFLTEMS